MVTITADIESRGVGNYVKSVNIECTNKDIRISVEGYGHINDDEGPIIFLEAGPDGRLRLVINSDVNQDGQQVIDLEKANNNKRKNPV